MGVRSVDRSAGTHRALSDQWVRHATATNRPLAGVLFDMGREIPLGRIGQPDDLPGAILFFASDDAAYVTGQVLSVSGGLTMAG